MMKTQIIKMKIMKSLKYQFKSRIKFLVILVAHCYLFQVSAQTLNTCGSDQINESLYDNSNKTLNAFDQMNQNWVNWVMNDIASSKKSGQGADKMYDTTTLPIVFHDLSSANIYSNTSVIDEALGVLNNNFLTEPNINFCLAQVDYSGDPIITSIFDFPSGEIPNGIVNLSNAHSTIISNVIQSTGLFPSTDYINVYVVDEIAGNVAGFAYLPSSHGDSFDGIYIESSYIIDPTSHVLTHEMGHYLGLLHTFGRCQPLFEECSCTNDNCLLDGDMVCDTPPDFSIFGDIDIIDGQIFCPPINSCETDAIGVTNNNGEQVNPFNANHQDNNTGEDIDAFDLTNNYMDYEYTECINSFTAGQADRMRFMIDPDIGPRNSLLSSNACNGDCAPGSSCEILIEELADIDILGDTYSNTIVLSAPTVNQTFNAQVTDCIGLDTFSWNLINLDDDTSVTLGNGLSVNANFSSTGNYQLELTASQSGSDPFCSVLSTLNIQVVSQVFNNGNGPGNCINLDDFNFIQYSGGWVYNGNSPNSGMRDPINSTGPQSFTPTGTDNNDPFAIINGSIPSSDPTFGEYPLPPNIETVVRVGRVIDGNDDNSLPPGAAYYSTFIFNPTEDFNKVRIWYLGLREDPANLPIGNPRFFSHQINGKSNGFGAVFASNITGAYRGLRHNASNQDNTNFNCFIFEAGNGYNRNTLVDRQSVNISGKNYSMTPQWNYYDLDLSVFSCSDSEVTITLFARTNSNQLGLHHSYAYFGLQCLPAISPPPVEFDFDNVSYSCLGLPLDTIPDSTQTYLSSHPFKFKAYGSNYLDKNMGLRLPTFFRSLKIETSVDGTNFSPPNSIILSHSLNDDSNLEFVLGMENNSIPFEYFKLTYQTPCRTYTDTVVIHQGFVHEVDPCPDLPITQARGGVLIDENDSLVTFCDSAYFHLTPPCWLNDTVTTEYQWQYSTTTGLPNSFINIPSNYNSQNEDFVINQENLVFFQSFNCDFIRRTSSYKDPYCNNQETWIPSEVFEITNLYSMSAVNDLIESPDVCLGDEVNLIFNIRTSSFSSGSSCLAPNYPNSYTFCISDANENPIIGTFTDENGTPLDGDSEGVSSFSFDVLGTDYPNIYFTFENTSPTTFDIIVNNKSKVYDCEYENIRTNTIYVKLSAIGGEIEKLPCSQSLEFLTVNTDNNNGLGYSWEYSYDNINFNAFSNSNQSNFIVPSDFPFSTYPVFVRRVANGSQDCPQLAYSNVIEINSEDGETIPIFDPVAAICIDDILDPLPQTSINGIIGTWEPSVMNNQITTTYTFYPDEIPGQECASSTTITVEVNDCGGCLTLSLNAIECASQGSNTPETCDDQWTFWITPNQNGAPGSFVNFYVNGEYVASTSYGNNKQVGFFDFAEYPNPVEVMVCDNEDPECCESIIVSPPENCSPPPCTGFTFENYSVQCENGAMTICYDVVGTNGACWATSLKIVDDEDHHGLHIGDGYGDQEGVCITIDGEDLEKVISYDDDHIILWGMICDTYNNDDCDDAPDVSECIIDVLVPYYCCDGENDYTEETPSCCKKVDVELECLPRKGSAVLTAYLEGELVPSQDYIVEWRINDILQDDFENTIQVPYENGLTYRADVMFVDNEEVICSDYYEWEFNCERYEKGLKVYPNPSEQGEKLFMVCNNEKFDGQLLRYIVTNSLGMVILEGDITVGQIIKLPDLQSGIYLVSLLNSGSDQPETKLFYVN